jgi:phosphoenolpyruvate carboxylase
MRWLGDPEKTNVELQIKGLEQFIREIISRDLSKEMRETVSTVVQSRNDNARDHNDLKQSINAISTKLIGTGIGWI